MYAPVIPSAEEYHIGRIFLESCTSTPATPAHLRMVDVAASLLRLALENEDDTQLVEYCATARERTESLHDIVATAAQVVLDRLIASGASAANVECYMSRVARITRTALPISEFKPEEFQRDVHAIV
ncbi:MAG: hypothetical protein NVSMB64_19860 [Candidatus Velthaea sp.]